MDVDLRLYALVDPAVAGGRTLPVLAAQIAGSATLVQLRDKHGSTRAMVEEARGLRAVLEPKGVPLLVNDRVDVALAAEADGVHIGQDDADYETARAALGRGAIVGVTCHDSKHLAYEAAEKGADYVAFGAFFPTGTKQPKTQADPEIVRDWAISMTVPCVAIGGITVENCRVLVEAGADFLAVVGGVWNYPEGPAAAVRRFNEIFAGAA